MTKEREFEGKDLNEALKSAASQLDTPEADLHYEILEQGRRGLLGMGVKSVRIRVMPPLEEELPIDMDREFKDELIGTGSKAEPKPESKAEPKRESTRPRRKRKRRARRSSSETRPADTAEPQESNEPESPAVVTELSQNVEQTVKQIVDLIGLDLETVASEEDGGIVLRMKGPDRKMLMSRNAELLSALQFLLNRMARRTWPDAKRIQIGTNGNKGPRDKDLVSMAKRAAEQVNDTGKTKKLRPMNAYERRLVHLTIREFSGLTSSSDGDGAIKSVRISKVQNAI